MPPGAEGGAFVADRGAVAGAAEQHAVVMPDVEEAGSGRPGPATHPVNVAERQRRIPFMHGSVMARARTVAEVETPVSSPVSRSHGEL
jgi:hypothetical protein